MNPDPVQDFTVSWEVFKWAIGTVTAAGATVAGFVWRLATRVELLEQDLARRIEMLEREQQLREKADDARHKENVHIMRGLQQQNHGLMQRIDRLYDETRRD